MSAFVCRETALTAVTDAMERPPVLILVEGEAGIGKTRLVQECLRSGSLPPRTVLVVACPPLPEPFPLGPVVEGLRQLREQIGDLELSPLAGALRPLIPEWADDLPPAPEPLEDALATRHRVYRALTELTDRLGVQLLVLEDAHWADTATLEWLLSAGASGGHSRSVVVTYRPQDVPPRSLLRRLISRVPSGMAQVRVALEPLDVAGIQQLTGSMFGTGEVSTEFASLLFERTGGLPLAVEESLRLLHDRGDIMRKGGEWARRGLWELRVPPTVRDSVLERVEHLGSDTRRVLEAVAVLAEPADETLLATVAGLEPPAARAGAEAGLRAGLLCEAGPGQVRFRHVLAAEAVEDAIPVLARRRVHQRAGEALQRRDHAPVVRLSRHFREAGDTGAWCRYAEASADLALESGDDHTTVTVLHELLTTVEHPSDRRARLARKLGEAAAAGTSLLGDRAGQLVEALRAVLADPGIPALERGEIRLLLGRLLLWWPGHRQAAYQEIEAAVPELADRPALACQAMMILGTPLVPDWPVRRHLKWVARAGALLPQVGLHPARLRLVADHARALLALGEESGWHAFDQIPRSASSLSAQQSIANGLLNTGSLAIDWGRYADARSHLDEAIGLIRAIGYQRLLNIALVACAYLDWCTGTWAGLGETAAGLARTESTEPLTVRLHAQQVQGLVELASGERAAAEQRLREVLNAYARFALVGPEAATAAAALGRIQLAEGAMQQVRQLSEPVMETISQKGMWLWATDIAPVHLAALVATGELEQAEDLARRFAGWLTGRDTPGPAASAVLCRAIVTAARGSPADAADLFAQAAAAWAALPRPYDELLALEQQGFCLLAADEPEQGLAILSDALRRMQELGARWDADRVAHQLRRHGVEVPRPWRSGPRGYGDQLSPREREVLALVARGMTNTEAGRVLFLSPRTVGHHLSTAMRKLGVSTRTTAAMAAADAGLIPAAPKEPGGSPRVVR